MVQMKFIASKDFGVQNAWIMADNERDYEETVADRLILLRHTVKPGMKIKAFAVEFLKVGYTRYHNVEKGGLPLSRDLASIIRSKIPGVTLEWLYYGDESRLHFELGLRISEEREKAKTRA